MQRTIVYVDGFNLYYRALRETPHRWLNLMALAREMLRPQNQIVAIKYYTARVSGKQDPGSPRRQQAYLNALATIPEVAVFFGHFLANTKTRPLVKPIPGLPKFVEVHNMEEKGSDVNLASHLIHDGWLNRYDVAAVISNDGDLVEPIRIVKEELKKPVGLLCPNSARAVPELAKAATFKRHVNDAILAKSQFPDPVLTPGGISINKPPEWYGTHTQQQATTAAVAKMSTTAPSPAAAAAGGTPAPRPSKKQPP